MVEAGRGRAGVVERLWAGELGAAGTFLGAVLAPAELAFRAVVAVRDRVYRWGLMPSHAPPAPAISVGNLTVGGTGKTPVVRWLVSRLAEEGYSPGILHGGYADDEPALFRRWFPDLPVVADRNRVRGAESAVAHGADILVLDDAFQHRRLRRDADLVLVAAETLERPARLLPRGPYREPPTALRRADLVIVTRRTASPEDADRSAARIAAAYECPVAVAALESGGWLDGQGGSRDGSPEGEVVAVAGVGRPAAFYEQAEGAGARVAGRVTFRDHHEYTARDAAAIVGRARGRAVVTTAKDAVKLAPLLQEVDVWVLDQTVAFESGESTVLETVRGRGE